MYEPISEPVSVQLKDAGMPVQVVMPREAKDYMTTYLRSSVPANRLKKDDLIAKMKYSSQSLTTSQAQYKFKGKKKDRGSSVLNSKRRKKFTHVEKKQYGIGKLDDKNLKFDNFKPLYKLWRSYAVGVLTPEKIKRTNARVSLTHAYRLDYTGCFLWVKQARCSSLVGAAGFVLCETFHTFQIIAKDNKIKCLPKDHTVFEFSIKGALFRLYGNELKNKTTDRAVRRIIPSFVKLEFRG